MHDDDTDLSVHLNILLFFIFFKDFFYHFYSNEISMHDNNTDTNIPFCSQYYIEIHTVF